MRSAPSPRLLAIAGNAVLTMVESSVCMKKLAETSHSRGCSERSASALAVSATGAFGLESQLDQFLDQTVPVIALDFNDAVAHRPTGAAQFLQPRAQRLKVPGGQWQAGDHGDTL